MFTDCLGQCQNISYKTTNMKHLFKFLFSISAKTSGRAASARNQFSAQRTMKNFCCYCLCRRVRMWGVRLWPWDPFRYSKNPVFFLSIRRNMMLNAQNENIRGYRFECFMKHKNYISSNCEYLMRARVCVCLCVYPLPIQSEWIARITYEWMRLYNKWFDKRIWIYLRE